MTNRIITQKARWNFQEIIPLIALYGFTLGNVIAIIVDPENMGLPLTGAIVFVILATWILIVSFKRKRNSTLYAKLGDDKNLNIEVWMRKPIEDKWRGRMDKGKNKSKLANIIEVRFETLKGTRIITFLTKEGKSFDLPTRLAALTPIKEYLGLAVTKAGELSFKQDEWAEEFAKYVIKPKAGAEEALSEGIDDELSFLEAEDGEVAENYSEGVKTATEEAAEANKAALSMATKAIIKVDYSAFVKKGLSVKASSDGIHNEADLAEDFGAIRLDDGGKGSIRIEL